MPEKHLKLKYETPVLVRETKMIFPMEIISKGRAIVCKQCSSCHGCR